MGTGFGMEVTVISTAPKKEKEALNTLGADHFVVSKDEAQMSVCALLLLCSWAQIYMTVCSDIICYLAHVRLSEHRAPWFGTDLHWRLMKT